MYKLHIRIKYVLYLNVCYWNFGRMKAKFISKSIQMISMKILAFGDIHSDKRKAKELAERAKKEKVDLVILTGDLTYNDDLSGIIGPFSKVGIKVLVIHGNHEDSSCLNVLEELYDNAKSVHGKYHIHDYVGFFGA